MDGPTLGVFLDYNGFIRTALWWQDVSHAVLWYIDLRWRCTERVSAYWRGRGFSSQAAGFMLIILKVNGELSMRLSSARIHQFRPRYVVIQHKLQTALV